MKSEVKKNKAYTTQNHKQTQYTQNTMDTQHDIHDIMSKEAIGQCAYRY